MKKLTQPEIDRQDKKFQWDIALAVSIRMGMAIATARNGLETLEKAGLLDDVVCGQKDQAIFISEEAYEFIRKFLNAAERKLPKEELMKHPK